MGLIVLSPARRGSVPITNILIIIIISCVVTIIIVLCNHRTFWSQWELHHYYKYQLLPRDSIRPSQGVLMYQYTLYPTDSEIVLLLSQSLQNIYYYYIF